MTDDLRRPLPAMASPFSMANSFSSGDLYRQRFDPEIKIQLHRPKPTLSFMAGDHLRFLPDAGDLLDLLPNDLQAPTQSSHLLLLSLSLSKIDPPRIFFFSDLPRIHGRDPPWPSSLLLLPSLSALQSHSLHNLLRLHPIKPCPFFSDLFPCIAFLLTLTLPQSHGRAPLSSSSFSLSFSLVHSPATLKIHPFPISSNPSPVPITLLLL